MKRKGNLFELIFTRENLYQAYLDACQGKHKKRACFNFERRLAHNLDRLYTAIHDGTYKPQEYYEFTVYEPKKRRIYAPSFCDLVVQHAIYRVVYPIFNATFIAQSFACRKGKGTHKAADYAQRALQLSPKGSYTIKLDIRKFFYSISRNVLRTQLEAKIKDQRLVDLMMMFAEYGEPVGIPIGNLLSQTYALIYLNVLDHFVKRVLKIKLYCRYVDDFILFGISRQECLSALERIKEFINGLGLKLSKYTIAPVTRGINFVGYRTWASRRFIRKHSLFKFARAIRARKLKSIVSILGHARRTHSLLNLTRSLRSKNYELYCSLPKVYRCNSHGRDLMAH
jgi:RNA-directed DNA polymerase